MKKLLIFCLITATISLLCGCMIFNTENIDIVKNGYLGGCFDVTVSELFDKVIPNGSWSSGITSDDKTIVEYKSMGINAETVIQFMIEDEDNFKIYALSVSGNIPQNTSESAKVINNYYLKYYSEKYPGGNVKQKMPDEPIENFLNGMSSSLAEKAKNPVEISNYFNKSLNDIENVLGVLEKDGFLYSGNGFDIVYDEDTGRINIAIVKDSRLVTLFGINSYMNYEDASRFISDRFEFVERRTNGDGTFDMVYIRNNSEDSLSLSCSNGTMRICKVSYNYNGLRGYRLKEEIKVKKAEFLNECDNIQKYTSNNLDTAYTQYEMNYESDVVFKKWDKLLNEIYVYLQNILPAEEFKNLEADELRWIKEKEAAINESGEMFKGGSAEPLQRNLTAIYYTKERVYYLISILDDKLEI